MDTDKPAIYTGRTYTIKEIAALSSGIDPRFVFQKYNTCDNSYYFFVDVHNVSFELQCELRKRIKEIEALIYSGELNPSEDENCELLSKLKLYGEGLVQGCVLLMLIDKYATQPPMESTTQPSTTKKTQYTPINIMDALQRITDKQAVHEIMSDESVQQIIEETTTEAANEVERRLIEGIPINKTMMQLVMKEAKKVLKDLRETGQTQKIMNENCHIKSKLQERRFRYIIDDNLNFTEEDTTAAFIKNGITSSYFNKPKELQPETNALGDAPKTVALADAKDKTPQPIPWTTSPEFLQGLSKALIKSKDMESGSIDDVPIKWISNDVDFAELFLELMMRGYIKNIEEKELLRIAAARCPVVNQDPRVLLNAANARAKKRFDILPHASNTRAKFDIPGGFLPAKKRKKRPDTI